VSSDGEIAYYYFEDPETEITFDIPSETDPRCYRLGIPASAFFSDIPGTSVAKETLLDHWDASYMFVFMEWPYYNLEFPDDEILISINSDMDGTIQKDEDFVYILYTGEE
jgi:hypothetical protein